MTNRILIITLIILASCSENKQQEKLEKENNLLGDWKGVEKFWSNSTDSGHGLLSWSFRITEDSINCYSYPSTFDYSSTIKTSKDSVSFIEGGIWSSFKFDIIDDTLHLVKEVFVYDKKYIDSSIYIKTHLDDSIIGELNQYGFSRGILEVGSWKFDKTNTVNYSWTNYDTTFYSPPKSINFENSNNYFIKPNTVLFQKDTFLIKSLNKDQSYYSLRVGKIINNDTIVLNYNMRK